MEFLSFFFDEGASFPLLLHLPLSQRLTAPAPYWGGGGGERVLHFTGSTQTLMVQEDSLNLRGGIIAAKHV